MNAVYLKKKIFVKVTNSWKWICFIFTQVGICCIAPPFIHIINNQELCRRTFGGKFCFNVPSSPSEHASSERRKSCSSTRKNGTDPSDHASASGSLWKNQRGDKNRDKQKDRNWKDIRFGSSNRAFEYEVDILTN